MTTTHRTESWWQVPRRNKAQRLATGVAAGIADELGVDPVVIRTVFVVLTITGGWGIPLYVLMWLWSAVVADDSVPTPRLKGRSERHRLLAIGLFTLGLMLLLRELRWGFVDSLVWPTAALSLGFLVVWRRAHDDEVDITASLTNGSSRWTGIRILAGIGMAAGGVATLLAFNLDLSAARHMVLAFVVVLAGLGLILGPWIIRIINDLTRERRLRIRSEERTEVAAHLHDSVLQTLALIQRNADDSQVMVQLARRQERELRDWLYGGGGATEASLRRAILDLAAEIEELHGVPVDAVVVGDFELEIDDVTAALLGATREALVNAAKHATTAKIDLYTEVGEERIDVFVRDTGTGFDLDHIAPDRRGITDSIRGRMARVGGTCVITTAPGDGTEVELTVPRDREGSPA